MARVNKPVHHVYKKIYTISNKTHATKLVEDITDKMSILQKNFHTI